MLFVLGLNKNFLSISVLEDIKGFVVEFKKRQVFTRIEEFSLETSQLIGFRGGNFYMLQGDLI